MPRSTTPVQSGSSASPASLADKATRRRRWIVILRRIGAVLLVLVSLGHLSMHVTPMPEDQQAWMKIMLGWMVELPGVTRSFWELHEGQSVVMGVLLLGFGAHLFASARANIVPRVDPTQPPGSTVSAVLASVFAILTAFAASLSSYRWFFIGPMALCGMAGMLFTTALILQFV